MKPKFEEAGKLRRRRYLPAALVALALLLLWAWPTYVRYTMSAPLPFLAAMALGLAVNLPTLLLLWLMVRKSPTPRTLFWAVPLSIVVLFGPLAAASNALFRKMHLSEYLFAGFSEESWKIMPLLLILLFAPRMVRNVRDGVLIGALGGFGFAIFEMGAYFALVDYPKSGWEQFYSESLARATLIGIDIHTVWSAFLGGAIVFGIRRMRGWGRWAVPLAAYLAVIFTHSLQDHYGKLLAVEPVVFLAHYLVDTLKIPIESIVPYQIPLTMFGATVNLLLINLPIIVLTLWMVFSERGKEKS
ncbi:PrsW family glutamic-type intramembrane protease [Nitratifractor sp.]